mmetsp:Transcript_17036/g.28288  ORF Transcript_17036/g.28288 Transcript_17036/m.28288 type:complete len:204 (-) Transcript_17036:1822-2433(-)
MPSRRLPWRRLACCLRRRICVLNHWRLTSKSKYPRHLGTWTIAFSPFSNRPELFRTSALRMTLFSDTKSTTSGPPTRVDPSASALFSFRSIEVNESDETIVFSSALDFAELSTSSSLVALALTTKNTSMAGRNLVSRPAELFCNFLVEFITLSLPSSILTSFPPPLSSTSTSSSLPFPPFVSSILSTVDIPSRTLTTLRHELS